ncbi:GIY-YIG nuclease family protein [Endothiovibrio diazotrophicus]
MSDWHVYMVRCTDGTLYTGVAVDPERRLAEHNGSALGARYTRARRPVELVYVEAAADRSAACKREAAIKRLSRAQKLRLVGEGTSRRR